MHVTFINPVHIFQREKFFGFQEFAITFTSFKPRLHCMNSNNQTIRLHLLMKKAIVFKQFFVCHAN